ncbi:PPOX class F420-dependent oxidoreductase [Actinotalea sp. BY-33]|uniref:PPOX class F420-dependent oxidoreductase n=1 Tax=Actinotalea soli TaxID=2819234 RepID=A0A939LVH1_9CELL|nr:PPOX class F420-dependent oxidoreductase [Actinotalea soli]MBO1753465.1 PPOX class F420-dependent oxidoreductase [Actinotalea soli]
MTDTASTAPASDDGARAAGLRLPSELVDLLRGTATCYLATVMPDGSPQLTQTWVDTDGADVLINTVTGHRKTRNVRGDPRVSLVVSSPARPSRYAEIRGLVTAMTTEGAEEHIEALAQRYLGRPYPWYGGRHERRVVLRISPRKITTMG